MSVVAVIASLFAAGNASAAVAPGSCSSHVSGDFDADGAADLAVGVPGQDVDSANGAGAVHVFYGSDPNGIVPATDDVITQNSGGVDDAAESGDAFGSCLVAGDFNGDGQSDLAIGVPGENVGSFPDAGAINVIYGTDVGLDAIGPPTDDFIHQNTSGVEGRSEDEDGFGSTLAAGDFDGDGRDDLAVGSPFDDIFDIVDGGAVNVLYGANGGVTTTGDQLWWQDAPNIGEASERGDQFGASVAAGDLDGNGDADLAVGVPGESVGAKKRAGAVQLLYSTDSGLSASRDVLWHQAKSGVVADGATASDRFGTAVAIGDFDGDGFGDLAVGTPGEGVGGDAAAGGVNVLYGSDTGVNASGDIFITQDASTGTTGDSAEPGDNFGASLAVADFEDDGESDDDLAVGAPGEDLLGGADAGAVDVFYGDDPNGLDPAVATFFSQDSPASMDDAEETSDAFGSALVAGDFDADDIFDLAIGAPGEDIGTEGQAGAVSIVYGEVAGLDPATTPADLFLHEDSGTAGDAEANDRFGASLG